jgi:hypothetical protein
MVPPGCMGRPCLYGRLFNYLECLLGMVFHPDAWKIILMIFNTSKYHIYVQYDSSKDMFVDTFIIWNPMEISMKGVR